LDATASSTTALGSIVAIRAVCEAGMCDAPGIAISSPHGFALSVGKSPRSTSLPGLSIDMVELQHFGHPERRHCAGSTVRDLPQCPHHTMPRSREGCDAAMVS
jgi:hypothetical protein